MKLIAFKPACKAVAISSTLIASAALFAACQSSPEIKVSEEPSKIVKSEKPQSLKAGEALIGKTPWKTMPTEITTEAATKSWFASLKGPTLVYWGAVWCPPCNEIKSEVFTQPDFANLTDQGSRVFVDGDSQNAQLISETLKVSGYPTILMIDEKGNEVSRFSSALGYEEFRDAYLASSSKSMPISERVEMALNGKATEADWKVLAYTNWDFKSLGIEGSKLDHAKTLFELAKLVPSKLKAESALMQSNAISEVSGLMSIEEKADQAFATKHSATVLNQTMSLLTSDEAALKTRSFVLYSSVDVYSFANKYQPKMKSNLKKAWLAAATKLANNDSLSVDTRLWATFPQLNFEKLDHQFAQKPQDKKAKDSNKKEAPKVKYTASTKKLVEQRVQRALSELKTKYERKAVVSGAAYMLRLVGEHDKGAEILLSEIKKSSTPYYYYSSLASLEDDRGNKDKALEYSAKASETSKGQATRLQWMNSDLRRNIKLKKSIASIQAPLTIYYDAVFEAADGFRGRNHSGIKRLAKDLQKLEDKTEVAKLSPLFTKYQSKCVALKGEDKTRCEDHFKKILTPEDEKKETK